MSSQLELLKQTSPLKGANAANIEQLYEEYLRDPESIDSGWRKHFDTLSGPSPSAEISHSEIRRHFAEQARSGSQAMPCRKLSTDAAEKQAAVLRLINAYRVRGHQNAALDPLQLLKL